MTIEEVLDRVFGAPIIGVVGGVIYMLTFRRT